VLEPRDDGWRVSDGLWERIEPLLPPRPRHPLGCHRPRVSDRAALDAILFVLRTGCQWSALSQTRICSKSSAYRRFREWAASGVFERLWQHLLDDPETPLDWAWLALDGQMVKAPKGGQAAGPNPTDRAKYGTKRSLVTDASGIPIGVVIDGANRHDAKLLEPTLTTLRIAVPVGVRPGVCLDRGYDTHAARRCVERLGFEPHVRSRTQELQLVHHGGRARRWVVEATFAWLVLFRRLKISYERLAITRIAFLTLACALITWRASHPATRAEAAY
jgi:putative transposase